MNLHPSSHRPRRIVHDESTEAEDERPRRAWAHRAAEGDARRDACVDACAWERETISTARPFERDMGKTTTRTRRTTSEVAAAEEYDHRESDDEEDEDEEDLDGESDDEDVITVSERRARRRRRRGVRRTVKGSAQTRPRGRDTSTDRARISHVGKL